MFKKIFYILFILSFTHILSAQEFSLYQNYMFNNLYNSNPAFAGYNGAFISQITVSKKWIGITDSPSSQVFSNSLRLGDDEFYDPNKFISRPFINLANRVGLGLTIFNETNGPLRHTGILFAYAYHLPLQEGRLSFGLSGCVTQYKLNTQEFKPIDAADPSLYSNASAIIPDANIGIIYYSPKFFSGISINRLINFNKIMDHTNTSPDIVVCGGYKFDIYNQIKFEPSLFLWRYGIGTYIADINTKFYFYNKYWLLLSYQTSGEVLTGFALSFMNGLQLSYSYAINTSGLADYNQGSQSISLQLNVAALFRKH